MSQSNRLINKIIKWVNSNQIHIIYIDKKTIYLLNKLCKSIRIWLRPTKKALSSSISELYQTLPFVLLAYNELKPSK